MNHTHTPTAIYVAAPVHLFGVDGHEHGDLTAAISTSVGLVLALRARTSKTLSDTANSENGQGTWRDIEFTSSRRRPPTPRH